MKRRPRGAAKTTPMPTRCVTIASMTATPAAITARWVGPAASAFDAAKSAAPQKTTKPMPARMKDVRRANDAGDGAGPPAATAASLLGAA